MFSSDIEFRINSKGRAEDIRNDGVESRMEPSTTERAAATGTQDGQRSIIDTLMEEEFNER